MKTIGVGVEGPSDQRFWKKLLHRTFPGYGFDVHNMSNRPKLIRESGRLLDSFRDAHYPAGIIVLDQDKNPCATDLSGLFDQTVRTELRRPIDERYLFLCIANRKIESWYLADAEAVQGVLPSVRYDMPNDTSIWGKRKLGELCRNRGMPYNEILFAEQIAPRFSVDRAMQYSESLAIGWSRVKAAVKQARGRTNE